VLSVVVASLGGLVVLLSWLPTDPLGAAAPVAAFVLFPFIFVCVFAASYDHGLFDRRSRRSITRPRLPGWRRWAAWLLMALYAIGFVTALAGGLGSPVREDGGYYDENHGEHVEISAGQYNDELAGQSRLFAGAAMAMCGVTALALSVDQEQLHRDDRDELAGLAASWQPPPSTPSGSTMVAGEVAAPAPTVVAALRQVVPVQADLRSPTVTVVRAAWTEDGTWWWRYGLPLWLVGSVTTTLRGTSLVVLELRVARRRPLGTGALAVVGVLAGAGLATLAVVAPGVLVLLGFFGFFGAINLALRYGARASGVSRAATRLGAAIWAPPPPTPGGP
jgi:hypothetical protein